MFVEKHSYLVDNDEYNPLNQQFNPIERHHGAEENSSQHYITSAIRLLNNKLQSVRLTGWKGAFWNNRKES